MQRAPQFEPTPKEERGISPTPSQNKGEVLSFEAEREKIKLNLFRMRKAYEVTQRLGFRDRSIDQGSIDTICAEMKSKGISEDEYTEFLKDETHYII